MRYRHFLRYEFAALLTLAALSACQQQTSGPSQAPLAVGPATLNVADAAIAGGDPNMALSITQSILKDDPNNADALTHEGDAYYALQRCPAAVAAYQLALKSNPTATAAQTGLGRCLLKTDPKGAETSFMAAVQDDPGNAAALNDLGVARDLDGNFAGAVDPYQRALLADPSMTSAEVNLGLSLALSGNGPLALQYLGPLATGPNATAKIRGDYAAALIASGRQDDARQVLGVDLPPDKVAQAMTGFNALIAGAQAPLPVGTSPPPATVAVAPTYAVSTTTLTTTTRPAPAPLPVAPLPVAPQPVAPPPVVPPVVTEAASAPSADPDAAYTGPSPISGAVSSSTGGPVTPMAESPEPPAPLPVVHVHKPSPVAAPVVAAAPPPASAAPAESSGGSTAMVQLGALNSQAEAQHAWSRISSAMPSLFGGKQPDIQVATVNGKTFYRLRTGGFASKADAARFCGQVSAAGNSCTIANF